MPDLLRSKLILSISMRFDVTGALSRAITDSFGGDIPFISPTMPRNCSTDTARASWSISIIVAQSAASPNQLNGGKSNANWMEEKTRFWRRTGRRVIWAYIVLWIYSCGHRVARSCDRIPTVLYRCAHSIHVYTLYKHHSDINVTSAALKIRSQLAANDKRNRIECTSCTSWYEHTTYPMT